MDEHDQIVRGVKVWIIIIAAAIGLAYWVFS